jgi:hypothetical protein
VSTTPTDRQGMTTPAAGARVGRPACVVVSLGGCPYASSRFGVDAW